jgi:nucleotide-binding universal stress UspA family protein
MTDSALEHPVVVGYDGSPQSQDAVTWAAGEAMSRQCQLMVVTAVELPVIAMGLPPRAELTPGHAAVEEQALRAYVERQLTEVVDRTRQAWPSLHVDCRMEIGPSGAALAQVAEAAELVVVGASGHGALPRMLLGSTAAGLAHQCARPVVVVRNAEDRHGPVVVGVDGSSTSARAIRFAFDFADRHGHEVLAVHAWSDLPLDALAAVRLWDEDRAAIESKGEQVLAESLSGHAERHPNVAVRRLVTFESPARALAEHAENATLLVVGSHGRGALGRMLLGSVSHAMIYHAPCSVAVVRAPRSD